MSTLNWQSEVRKVELYDKVQMMLNESSISAKEFSEKSGVAYNTVRAIKAGGGNPTMQTLNALADCLLSMPTGKCGKCEYFAFGGKESGCLLIGWQVTEHMGCAVFKEF